MKKFGRDKIALFLACTSVLGGKTQAMNTSKAQSPQTVAAVGGATSRINQSVKQGLTKNQKLVIGLGIGLGLPIIFAIATVATLKFKSKNSENDDNKNNGIFSEKNQNMIQSKLSKLSEYELKNYKSIKDYMINYKQNDIFKRIKNIWYRDKNITYVTDDIRKEHIKFLDKFIDIFSGKNELNEIKFYKSSDDEAKKNFELTFRVNEFQFEIKKDKINIFKVADNKDILIWIDLDISDLKY